MPDHQEALDLAAALHALGHVLDDDAPLPAEVRMGIAVILTHLARRMDDLGGRLLDQHYKLAA